MKNTKFSLTTNTKNWFGTTLFQIKAEMSFGNVSKGELGGWIEKEDNLSVSGNAWVFDNASVFGNASVSGNASVYGEASVSAKLAFTKGWFIGGDDTGKITNITEKMGNEYWKAQYVLGDYEIKEIEEEKKEIETIEIGGIKYSKEEVEAKLKDIKPIQ